MASSKPCLCTLEYESTLKDYVVIEQCAATRVVPSESGPETQGNSSPSQLRQAFMRASNFVLRAAKCCKEKGWTDYPNHDHPDHSLRAHAIFLELGQKIQECRVNLSPPVTMFDLDSYRFQSTSTDTMYSQYYYLRIKAGENFYLYVKVGLTSENYSRVNLLRLTSKEDKVV